MKAWLLVWCVTAVATDAARAQEASDLEPRVTLSEAENLGDSLFVSDAVEARAADIADDAGEALAHTRGQEAGRRGRWQVEPHVVVRGTYDDNIFIQHEDSVADYIFTLAPGVAFGFWDADQERERQLSGSVFERVRGNYLIADYTAILLNFADTPSQNALDHDARLEAQWEGEKLILGVRVHPESKSETNRDLGDRVQRKTLTTAATARYLLTEKTAFGLGLHHVVNEPEDYLRTAEWRAESSIDYALTPMVRLGVGADVGRVEVESASDQTFERLLARVAHVFDAKIDSEFRGGVEFRQSEGAEGGRTTPVFEARAGWTPTLGTRVGVEAFRRLEVSAASPEQDYTLTGVGLTVRQAIRGGFNASLAGGYHRADYTGFEMGEERTDRYLFVRPGVFYSFAEWGTAGVSYEHRRNDSSRAESGFINNQTTVEIGLRY